MQSQNLEELLSLYEAYLVCQIPPERLRHLCESLTIPAQKVAGIWKIKRFDLELYLLQRRIDRERVAASKPSIPSEYLTLDEAAKLARQQPHRLALLCGKKFPALRMGSHDWLIKRSDFEAYLATKPKRGR